VLRELKARGISEPRLVTGDGALGLWGALRDVFPHAREQRCWVHKTADVLDALPSPTAPWTGNAQVGPGSWAYGDAR
jgi:putative transposase